MDLTNKQKEIALLVLQGKTNKEMAEILNIKSTTYVKVRINRLLEIFGVTNRYQFFALFCTIPDMFRIKELDPVSARLDALGLSERQREVAYEIVVGGLSNKEIAHKHNRAESTIRNQVMMIYRLLNISSREELNELINSKVRRMPVPKIKYDNSILPIGLAK